MKDGKKLAEKINSFLPLLNEEQKQIIPQQFLRKEIIDITVYPNPASKNVFIEMDIDETSDVNIMIHNMTGSAVISRSNSNLRGYQNFNIPLNTLQPGSYIIRVMFNNEPVAIKKLIVR